MPKILYVEDHPDTREAISQMLRRAGYEVETARNGKEALVKAMAGIPDLLLLDLALPELNGVKLIHVLRSYLRFSGIPVIVLTGMAAGTMFEEAKELNPSALLLKDSVDFNQILAAVQKALGQKPSARVTRALTW